MLNDNRVRTQHLDKLVAGRELGGYTLPSHVIAAHDSYLKAAAVTLPTSEPLHPNDAAVALADAYAAGDQLDALKVARRVADAAATADAAAMARTVHQQALLILSARAVTIAQDAAETIITEHLRPAYSRLLEQGRQAAAVLDGYSRSTTALMSAPAKVRTAYLSITELVSRHDALWQSRYEVVKLAALTPQLDDHGWFLEFANPLALRPGWRVGSQVRALETPKDPVERMLWLCGPATVGEPWMPTPAEMDAAWDKQFGDAMRARAQGRRDAQAFGAVIAG